jgi:FMN phosphatase YigB (HAD superfamily)
VAFLDWAGTLSNSGFWGHWREESGRDWQTIQARLFGDRDLIQAWMRGQLTAEDVIARLLADTDQDGDRWLRELERSCREMRFADDSLWELVPRIRALGTKVVIATDNMDTFPRWTIPALGMRDFVDDILDSWTLGVLKEDVDDDGRSRFFGPWLEANGMAPSETVLFDDGDLIARNLGLEWIQVTEEVPLATAIMRLWPEVVP